MNIRLLSAALLAGLALSPAAGAQDFDDRWYLTGSTGFNFQDNDRTTRNAPFVALGLGKFVSPNWSIDGELNYQNPNLESNQDLNWSQYGISFDLRRHFITEGRNWNPYALMGIGYQRAEEEFDAFPNPNSPGQREDGNLAAKLGLGLQGDLGRIGIRTELAYRIDFDNSSVAGATEDEFGDMIASVGFIIPLGPEPMVAVAPAPLPPPPMVEERCPPARPGQVIGPDGCPVDVTIDLRGVNFDFDRATLRPDAVSTLNEAAEILRRYPDLRVEVAGHTDLCGSDAYNQALSERRARTVYDYLTGQTIDAGRLVGPVGYGESRPLEMTPQTLPGCKSETNRRTELNVQN